MTQLRHPLEFLRRPLHICRSNGPKFAMVTNFPHIGAVMNDHSQRDNGSSYSPLMCILLLLATGIGVKFGAAVQLGQLAAN
jgi:hypothetical protein